MGFLNYPKILARAAVIALRRNESSPAKFFSGFRNSLSLPANILETVRTYVEAGDYASLDRLAQNIDLYAFQSGRPEYLHDVSAFERRTILEVSYLTAQSADAMVQLIRSVEHVVKAGIGGAFVECGVYRGASIVAIIRTLQNLQISDRDVWLYDTFEGMPEPDEIDTHYKQTPVEDGGVKSWALHKRNDGTRGSDWCFCPIDQVKKTVARLGYPADRVHFVKGLVEETIPANAPPQIALLRLDTDFYSSTKHELEQLYPRVASGGVIIVDDYGAYRGSRQAVDEYIQEKQLKVILARTDENVRMWVKP